MQAKILIVDDREDNLVSIEAILGSENYRFTRANSGKQALKILLQEFDFALILMDVKMPSLNGFDTAALIYEREKLKNIPIIFITAHNYGEDSIFRGYRTGAVDYIAKPINPELLKAKVSVFVDLYMKNYRLLQHEQKLITINKNLESEINERKNSEEKIKALNVELLKGIDRLEQANKDLDRFAFMASHDLQEPLRKIRVFSERLSDGYGNLLDETGKKYIERIQTSAARMQILIKDILTFSQLSSGKGTVTDTNLNLVIDEVLKDLEETIKENNVNIVVDKLPSLMVNPVLIQPLFHNLISNGIKYRRNDVQPFIHIYAEAKTSPEQLQQSNEPHEYCRIFIEDNGIGFEQKYSEQIFSMFKRLHHSQEYEGTGIGLALCKKIVEEHRGFISALSKVNQGSTFIVSLPKWPKEIQKQEHIAVSAVSNLT